MQSDVVNGLFLRDASALSAAPLSGLAASFCDGAGVGFLKSTTSFCYNTDFVGRFGRLSLAWAVIAQLSANMAISPTGVR